MDRHLAKKLKTFTVLLLMLTAIQARAAASGQFCICGDVRTPQTYQTSTVAGVTLRGLIGRANQVADGMTFVPNGTAIVLRGHSLQAAIVERIDGTTKPSASGEDTALMTGDVILFRADFPMTGNDNAIVLATDIPDVLMLPASIQNLKKRYQIPAGSDVRVTRVVHGEAISHNLNDGSFIQHGDIVHVAEAIAAQSSRARTSVGETEAHVDTTSVNSETLELMIPGMMSAGSMEEQSPDPASKPLLTRQPVPPENEHPSEHMETRGRTASVGLDLPLEMSDNIAASGRETDNRNAGMWNIIFVLGLLCAMGLIGIGWVRTQQEREVEARVSQSIRENTEASSIQADVLPEMSNLPVASGDNAESNILADAWFTSEESDSTTTIEAVTAEAANAAIASEAEVVRSDVALSSSEEAVTDTDTDTEMWTDLEDLIQNRLPVELTELDLPLRVNLFGQPAGPKKLRIDAAHTEVAPPQFAQRARSRVSRPAAPASAAAGRVDGDRQKPEGVEAGDVSRLDHALNFLEEQSET